MEAALSSNGEMESRISANRVIGEVSGYEIWIPEEHVLARWEAQYGGTFATLDCEVEQLVSNPGVGESDSPLSTHRLMVPIVKREGTKYRVLRNAESVELALTGSDTQFPVLELQV